MNRNLFPIVLLLLQSLNSSAQEYKEVASAYLKLQNDQEAYREIIDDSESSVFYEGLPFTGYAVEYRLNGKPRYKIRFIEGIKNGQYLNYDEDGKIELKGNYVKGRKEGEWLGYYQGYVTERTNYFNGKKHGEYSQFGLYEHSKELELMEKGSYKEGQKNGEWIRYSMGVIQTKENYSNGLLNGEYSHYDVFTNYPNKPSHSLWEHSFYKHGQLDGEQLNYYTGKYKGILRIKSYYKEGVLDGERLFYYKNQKLEKKETYLNGDYNGEFSKYSEDGRLVEKAIWNMDVQIKYWSITYGGAPDF